MSESKHSFGVELMPDWTPSMNPRLVRLDAIIKVAAGAWIAPGTALRARLKRVEAEDLTITLSEELSGLTGPDWRQVRGRLIEIDPAVWAAEGMLPGCVSAPVFRRDGQAPVFLAVIRDRIGVADEPILWWRYYNATNQLLNVAQIRAQTRLRLDGQSIALRTNYNGPSQLPPGRAMSGLWRANDLPELTSGTYQIQLVIGDHASTQVTLTL